MKFILDIAQNDRHQKHTTSMQNSMPTKFEITKKLLTQRFLIIICDNMRSTDNTINTLINEITSWV